MYYLWPLLLALSVACSQDRKTTTALDPTQPSAEDVAIAEVLTEMALVRSDPIRSRHSITAEDVYIDAEATWEFYANNRYKFHYTVTDSGRSVRTWSVFPAGPDTLQLETGRWSVLNHNVLFRDIKGKVFQPDGSYRTYDLSASHFPIEFWGDGLDDPFLFVEFGRNANRFQFVSLED